MGLYEILAPIGAGGMGEVYRAKDTKLGRNVALKVLSEAFSQDAEYVARSHREAQVLASLNHSHIASIYGLEESVGIRALVMELVEGPTLADRVKVGPVPLEEALEVARQIAEALEYAHEKGVVHRDLKPANVKLTTEGTVKVLDFGLAKAAEPTLDSEQWENSPTQPVSMSEGGVILGTAAYMAPEQARGEVVDKRADIWAFGVVLWELLCGRRLFGGGTTAETLADVLRAELDFSKLPAGTPIGIRKLLRRCLERDKKKRLRDIGDARMELEEYLADPVGEVLRAQRPLLPWVLSTTLVAAFSTVLLLYFRQSPPASPLVQFSIQPPEKEQYMHLAPSPDGRMIAFSSAAGANSHIWLRRFDSLTLQPLAGSDGGLLPFWSPDSRYVGFWAYSWASGPSKLKMIDMEAPSGPGRLRTLCDTPGPGGATWSRDGVIVFSGGQGQPLYRTSASGGEVKALTSLDPSMQEKTHFWPWFLPDGRHFLYTIVSDKPENSGVYVGTLDSPERKRLLGDLSNAVYVTVPPRGGLLLFVRGDTLMAQRFAAATLRLSAEPFPVAEQVGYSALFAQGYYAVSESGVLAYLSGGGQSQLTWFDRIGKRIGTIGEPGTYNGGFSLSPDDKRVAVALRDPETGTSDIWLIEAGRGVSSRLTFDPKDDLAPVWSPDGERLVFSSNRGGAFDLYQKDANGGGKEQLLLKSGLTKWARDWSRDGRYVLYNETDNGAHDFLWMLPLFGDRKPVPFQRAESWEGAGALSPDGKWVAFHSADLGKNEVYVRAVPGTETVAPSDVAHRTSGKWRISTGGGEQAQWRRDGRELYYLAPDDRFMAVGFRADPRSQPGVPRVLFEASRLGAYDGHGYAVTADGQRFLVLTRIATNSTAATVLLNWTKGLKP